MASIKASSQQTIIQQLYNCYSPEEADKLIKKLDRPLHLFNRKLMVDLIRREILPEYPYADLIKDYFKKRSPKQKQEFLMVLKYSIKGELYKQGMEPLIKLANFSKKDYPALESILQLMEEYTDTYYEDITVFRSQLEELSYIIEGFGNLIETKTSKSQFINKGQSIAPWNSSKVETIMQMHKTMNQEENEDIVLLKIELKFAKKQLKDEIEVDNSEDELPRGQEGGCNQQGFFRKKSKEIEISYQKSRNQPIAIQFINGVLKKMIEGTSQGFWTRNFDRLLLKCLSYQIILNNMKFNTSSVQTPLFETILSHLKEHPGNWNDKVFKVGRDNPIDISWNHYKSNSAYTSCGLAEHVKKLQNKIVRGFWRFSTYIDDKDMAIFVQELAKQCRIRCIKIIAKCIPHYKDKNRLMNEIKALALDPQKEVKLKCQEILVKKNIPIENQEIFMDHLLKSFRTGEQFETERDFIRAYIRANFRSTYITKDILTDFFRGLQYIKQNQTKGNGELIKAIQKESLTSTNLVDQYISKYIIFNQGLPNDILEIMMKVYLTSNHKDALDKMEDFMYLAANQNKTFDDRVIYQLSKSKQKRVLCFFLKLLFKLSQKQQNFQLQQNEQMYKLLSNEQFIANTGYGHVQFCSSKNPNALEIGILAADTFRKLVKLALPLFMYLIDKYRTLKDQVRLSLLTSVRTNIQWLAQNKHIQIRKLFDLHSNQNNISCRAHLSKAILFKINYFPSLSSSLNSQQKYQDYDDASIINLFQSRGSQCNDKDLVTDINTSIIQVLKCQQQPSQKVRGIFILVLANQDFLYLHQKVIRKCEQILSKYKTLNKDLVSAIERYLLTRSVNQDSIPGTFRNIKNFTTLGIQFSNRFVVESIRKINNERDRQELLRIYSVQSYYEDNIYYLLLQFRVARNINNLTLKPYIDTALRALIKNLDKTEFLYPEFPSLVASSCDEFLLYFFADYLLEKHLLIYYIDIETSLLSRIKSMHNSQILKYLTLFLKDGYHLTQQTLKYIRSLPIKYSQQYVTLISYLCLNQNVAVLKLKQYCNLIAEKVDNFDKSMVVGTLEYYLAKYTDELLDEDKFTKFEKWMNQAPKQVNLLRTGFDIANRIKGFFFESSQKQSISWEQEEENKKKRINFNESIGNILRNKKQSKGVCDYLLSIVNDKKNQFTNEFYTILEKLLENSNEDLLSTVINICIMLAKVDPQFYNRFNSETLFVEIQKLRSSSAFISNKSSVNTKLEQMFKVFDQSGAKQLDSKAWKKLNIYRESKPEDKVRVFKDISENGQLSKGETIQLIDTIKNNEDESIYLQLLQIIENLKDSEELNTLITEIANIYKIQKFSNDTQQRVIEVFLQKYGKINNQSSQKALLEVLVRILKKNINIMSLFSKHKHLIIRELISIYLILSKKYRLVNFKDLVQNCWMYLGPESTFIHQFIEPIPHQVLIDKQMPNEMKVLVLQNLIRIRDYNLQDQNLFNLAQQMIKSMCATPAIMRYYRLIVETFISQQQYFEDDLLLSSIYKYLESKDQNIRIEAVQLLTTLHSDSKQIVTRIAGLCHQADEMDQPGRMKKLLYKCFLSLCSDIQDKTFCQIYQAIKTALDNKDFPLNYHSLKLISTCSYFVIKTDNVTQLLCNDLYYRVLKDLCYPDLQGFKTLFFESCRHLISSQDIMQSSMQRTAAFIQEIHRLIDAKDITFEDLIWILNYSKIVGFQRVTLELGVYGSKIIDVIVYKYAQSKERKLSVWELKALRMSIGLTKTIELLLSQTQQKQMPSIVTYFCKLKEKGEPLQKVKFINSKVDYRVQAIVQLSILKIGQESSLKLASELINLFTKVSFKMHFSVYDRLRQSLTKLQVQQLTQTLIGIVQYRLEDSPFQTTLQLQHVVRLQKLNQLFLHRTPTQEARSQLQTLEQLINRNKSKSHTKQIASSLKNTFKECRRQNIKQFQGTKLTSQQLPKLTKSTSKLSKSKQSSQMREDLGLLSLYLQCLAKIKKVHLRPSQIAAIWTALINLKSKEKTRKGTILQVGTGEGKSYIIVGLATILVSKGYLVDIVTSSPVLAERDSADHKNLYKQMKITCASNVDSTKFYESGVKQCYNSQVVYGDITQFEFDWLRHEFQNLGTRSQRYKDISRLILLVDEADNIMVDNMFYIARLADSFPGIQSLQPFYFFIWNNFQSALTKLLKIDGKWYWVKGNVLVKQGKIHIHYIGQIQDQNQQEQQKNFEDVENILMQQKRNSKPISDLPFIKQQEDETSCQAIIRKYLNNVAEEMLSKSEFLWSQSAKAHAQVSIQRWVDSIIMAYVMEEDVNYIVSEYGSIKPVDFANTGVIQSNTSLSYGTHQFLEVKHSCRMTLETRTTNFISNYSFIKQYKANIVGLTGTIGGQSTEAILDRVYGCDSYYIPRYMKEALHRLPTITVPTSQQWINQIADKAILETLKKRGVLIICLTIKITQLIRQRIISKSFVQSKIKMYSSNEDESSEKAKECQSGEIIIATNLAGRGTDIKTDSIEKFGGLHIILTFLPESKRIQQQAEGRTARKGKRGSVQLILQNTNILVNLEIQRDSQEKTCAEEIIQEDIQLLENRQQLFGVYMEWLKQSKKQLKNKKPYGQYFLAETQDRFSQIMSEHDYKLEANKLKEKQMTSRKLFVKKVYMQTLNTIKELKNQMNNGLANFQKLLKNPDSMSQQGLKECFLRNGCYYSQMAYRCTQGFFDKRSQSMKKVSEKLLQAAKSFNPNDFNPYYMNAYYLLNGKHNWLSKNDHKVGYKQQAAKQLAKAKQLLLNEMSGYEGMLVYLGTKDKVTSKLFRQIQTRLHEILKKCLDSIEALQEILRGSSNPISLSYENEKERIVRHIKINRQKVGQNLNTLTRDTVIKLHSLTQKDLQSVSDIFSSTIKTEQKLFEIKGSAKSMQLILKQLYNKKCLDDVPLKIKITGINAEIAKRCYKHIQSHKSSVKFFFSRQSLLKQKDPQSGKSLLELFHQTGNKEIIKNICQVQNEFKAPIQGDQMKEIDKCLSSYQIQNNVDKFLEIIPINLIFKITFKTKNQVTTQFLEELQQTEMQCSILDTKLFQKKKTGSSKMKAQQYADSCLNKNVEWNIVIYYRKDELFQLSQFIKKYNKKMGKDDRDIDISRKTKLEEMYNKYSRPDKQIALMYNRGFYYVYSAQNRKAIPWGAIAFLAGVAVAQIVIGSALILTGAGATVGISILSESINEIFQIVNVFRTREFNFKSYLLQKAVSLTLSVITMGWGSLKNVGKGTMLAKSVLVEAGQIGFRNAAKAGFKLIGKKLLIESGKQLVSRTVSGIMDKIIELVTSLFREKFTSAIKESIRNMPHLETQFKIFRYVQKEQRSRGGITINQQISQKKFSLQQQIQVALYPPPTTNPYIKKIVDMVRNRICSVVGEMINKTKYKSILQIAQITEALILMLTGLQTQVYILILLIQRKFKNTTLPQLTIKRYVQKRVAKKEQRQLILQTFYKNQQSKEDDIKKYEQSISNAGMKTLNYLMGQTNVQKFKLLINSNSLEKDKIQDKLQSLLALDCQDISEQDLQIVEKILTDFIQEKIHSAYSGIITPIACKYAVSFASDYLEVKLANVADHREQATINYADLKQRQLDGTATEQDLIQLEDYEKPQVSKQLEAFGRYQALSLANNYKKIQKEVQILYAKKIGAQIDQLIQKKKHEKQDAINQNEFMVISKELGKNIKITRNPTQTLSAAEINQGIELVLYEQGNFGPKGQNIGHYVLWDKKSGLFEDVQQQSETSCGLDVLRKIQSRGGNTITNKQLQQKLWSGMKKNAVTFLECEKVDKWLCSQFPKHANALVLKGGVDFVQVDKVQKDYISHRDFQYNQEGIEYLTNLYKVNDPQQIDSIVNKLPKQPGEDDQAYQNRINLIYNSMNLKQTPSMRLNNGTPSLQCQLKREQIQRTIAVYKVQSVIAKQAKQDVSNNPNCVRIKPTSMNNGQISPKSIRLMKQWRRQMCLLNAPNKHKIAKRDAKKQMVQCMLTNKRLPLNQVASLFRKVQGGMYNNVCRHQNQALAQKYLESRVLQKGDLLHLVGVIGVQGCHELVIIENRARRFILKDKTWNKLDNTQYLTIQQAMRPQQYAQGGFNMNHFIIQATFNYNDQQRIR